jgi:hypothetical protein
MSLSRYGLEKLHSAVSTLAQSQESLQQRLTTIGVYDLVHITPERDLPSEDLKKEFDTLFKALTRLEPSGNKGSIEVSVAAMGDEEVRRHIETVLSLCFYLEEYLAIHGGKV